MGMFDRYLARAILLATLLVLSIIVFLDAFLGFMGESDNVAKYAGYSNWHALAYVFMKIPGKMLEYLPPVTLIGSLLGLGALAGNSELTALRAAGMSKARIIWGGMKTGLLIALAMLLMSEYVTPASELNAAAFRAQARGKQITAELRNHWLKNGDEFVYIGRARPGYLLERVSIFTTDGKDLVQRQHARQAQLKGSNWELAGVDQTQFDERAVDHEFVYTQERKRLIEKDLFDIANVKPRNMALNELSDYIDYLKENGLESKVYRKAFWNKITGPLSILVMMLIAMPFVFSNRRAGNAGTRLVIGILFGMAFNISSELLSNLGQVYGLPVLFSAFAPLVVFTVIGLWLLRGSEG